MIRSISSQWLADRRCISIKTWLLPNNPLMMMVIRFTHDTWRCQLILRMRWWARADNSKYKDTNSWYGFDWYIVRKVWLWDGRTALLLMKLQEKMMFLQMLSQKYKSLYFFMLTECYPVDWRCLGWATNSICCYKNCGSMPAVTAAPTGSGISLSYVRAHMDSTTSQTFCICPIPWVYYFLNFLFSAVSASMVK